MLKKEFQEVFKQSLVYIGLSIGIPLVLKIVYSREVGSFFEVFFLMFQYSLLVFGVFMGLSLFLPDIKQRAEDYVYSLPYSRLKLLVMKLLPRLAAVSIFYLLFVLLYFGGGQGVIMSHSFFSTSWLYWLLFGMAISFSASTDGYMKTGGAALLGAILFLALFFFAVYLAILLKGGDPYSVGFDASYLFQTGFSYAPALFLVVCLFLIIPFAVSFVLAFKKWGLHSKKKYNKGFFKLLVPLLVLSFIVSTLSIYAFLSEGGAHYYLTAKHRLIETTGFSTGMYDAEGLKLKYNKGKFIPLCEDETIVYGMHKVKRSLYIVGIDQENYRVETLRKGPRLKKWRYRNEYMPTVFKNFIAVPENRLDEGCRFFVFIDTLTKTIKEIKIEDVLPRGYKEPVIFGADRVNGKTFWLIHDRLNRYPIIKMWEDGTTEKLGMSRAMPLYFNRKLITFNGEAMVINKITGGGPVELQKIPGYKGFGVIWRVYNRTNLNTDAIKELYCARLERLPDGFGKYYLKFNLETLEISRLEGVPASFFALRNFSGDVYGIEYRYDKSKYHVYVKKMYRFQEGKINLIKEFPPYEGNIDDYYFQISRGGILIKQGNRFSIYSFPEMEPLQFRGF